MPFLGGTTRICKLLYSPFDHQQTTLSGMFNNDHQPSGSVDRRRRASTSSSTNHRSQRKSTNSSCSGSLMEIHSSENSAIRFKIDCAADLSNSDCERQLEALKSLNAVFRFLGDCKAGPATLDGDVFKYKLVRVNNPFSRGGTPFFMCDTLLINTELVDKLFNILETSLNMSQQGRRIDLALALQVFAAKILDKIDMRGCHLSQTEGLNEIQCVMINRQPRLLEVLYKCSEFAGCSGGIRSVLLSNAVENSHKLPEELRRTLSKTIIGGLRLDAAAENVCFRTALNHFKWHFFNEDEKVNLVNKLLPCLLKQLTHTRTVKESSFRLVVGLMKKIDVSTIAPNVGISEAVLQMACFHPDPMVQCCSLSYLVECSERHCLELVKQHEENNEALYWWTHRCLPTWTDMLTQWQFADEGVDRHPAAGAIPHLAQNICQLVSNQHQCLAAPDMADISLFAMALVDSGDYEKLRVATESVSADCERHRLLRHICDVLRSREGCPPHDNVSLLQFVSWRWEHHLACPNSTRVAVCVIFSAPLHKHPRTGEVSALPSEVAFEICSYLPIRKYFTTGFKK